MKISEFQDVANIAVAGMMTVHGHEPGWSQRASIALLTLLHSEAHGELACRLRESIFEAKPFPEDEVCAILGQQLYVIAAKACVLQLDLQKIARSKAIEIERAMKGRSKPAILKTRIKSRATRAKKGAKKA